MSYTPERDLNHIYHVDPDHRYACINRPRINKPWLPLNESNTCGHTYRKTDPSCTDCIWRHNP